MGFRRQGLVLLGLCAHLIVAGCQKQEDPNNKPVDFWADPQNKLDSDPCTHATAQAIVKSGLPYPRFAMTDFKSADGKSNRRVPTVDVWVGDTRFTLPAELVKDSGAYAKNHPKRFWGLSGSLPNFHPKGEPGPAIDGMGSMVDVTIQCSVDRQYVASWGSGYRTTSEGIAKTKERYEESLNIAPNRPGSIFVTVREDLGMTEVLLDRYEEANNRRFWEATYWPLEGELKSPDGSISGIGCKTRHDPEKRYGNVGWRCSSAYRVTPQANMIVEVYVSQIRYLPGVYRQIHTLLLSTIDR